MTEELKNELQKLDDRAADLNAQLQAAIVRRNSARERLIWDGGEAKTLVLVQTSCETIMSVLEEIENRYAAKRVEIEASERADKRAVIIVRLQKKRDEINAAAAELDKVAKLAFDTLNATVPRVSQLWFDINDFQSEFQTIARDLDCPLPADLAEAKKLQGSEIQNHLEVIQSACDKEKEAESDCSKYFLFALQDQLSDDQLRRRAAIVARLDGEPSP